MGAFLLYHNHSVTSAHCILKRQFCPFLSFALSRCPHALCRKRGFIRQFSQLPLHLSCICLDKHIQENFCRFFRCIWIMYDVVQLSYLSLAGICHGRNPLRPYGLCPFYENQCAIINHFHIIPPPFWKTQKGQPRSVTVTCSCPAGIFYFLWPDDFIYPDPDRTSQSFR